jgi:hypothetical protein
LFIGIPAIVLYAYALLVPWTKCRVAIRRSDLAEAEQGIAHIRAVFGIVLAMGLVASIVSGAGRYAVGGAGPQGLTLPSKKSSSSFVPSRPSLRSGHV